MAGKGRPKGQPKSGGVQKGYKHEKTRIKEQRIDYILSVLEPTFEKDVLEMKAHERARMYFDCMEYKYAKLARTELAGKVDSMGVFKVQYETIKPGNIESNHASEEKKE